MATLTLTSEDIEYLHENGGIDIELAEDALKSLNLDELIQNGIAKHTGHASTLYQEIRKQVDEYMSNHLPTKVGNYVRCTSHTADKIIRENVAKEIERGVESGMKIYAKKYAAKIAAALLPEKINE